MERLELATLLLLLLQFGCFHSSHARAIEETLFSKNADDLMPGKLPTFIPESEEQANDIATKKAIVAEETLAKEQSRMPQRFVIEPVPTENEDIDETTLVYDKVEYEGAAANELISEANTKQNQLVDVKAEFPDVAEVEKLTEMPEINELTKIADDKVQLKDKTAVTHRSENKFKAAATTTTTSITSRTTSRPNPTSTTVTALRSTTTASPNSHKHSNSGLQHLFKYPAYFQPYRNFGLNGNANENAIGFSFLIVPNFSLMRINTQHDSPQYTNILPQNSLEVHKQQPAKKIDQPLLPFLFLAPEIGAHSHKSQDTITAAPHNVDLDIVTEHIRVDLENEDQKQVTDVVASVEPPIKEQNSLLFAVEIPKPIYTFFKSIFGVFSF